MCFKILILQILAIFKLYFFYYEILVFFLSGQGFAAVEFASMLLQSF